MGASLARSRGAENTYQAYYASRFLPKHTRRDASLVRMESATLKYRLLVSKLIVVLAAACLYFPSSFSFIIIICGC